MNKLKGLIFTALLVAGCATLDQTNMDWIPIGPEFPPTKAQEIEIISGRQDVTRPYGNLGLLRIKNIKPTRDSIHMGIEKGKKFAASKGANAMQVGQYNSAEDGATDPRITLILYLIKYVDNLTPQDEKAIENFKEVGILNERTGR